MRPEPFFSDIIHSSLSRSHPGFLTSSDPPPVSFVFSLLLSPIVSLTSVTSLPLSLSHFLSIFVCLVR